MKLVDRYIFKQLLDYFLLGLVVFTLIAFFSDTLLNFIREVRQYGIPLSTMLTMIGLQLPKSVALTLPAASFVAALMVYNQMNNDFEIISMRTGGISLWRLMAPAILLGVLCSIASYLLSDFVVPFANMQTEKLKAVAVNQAMLPTGGSSFMFPGYDRNHRLQQLIYISKFKGKELGDSTIIDLSKRDVMQVVQARSGRWRQSSWQFNNANVYLVSRDTSHSSSAHFDVFTMSNLINRSDEEEKIKELTERREKGVDVDPETQSFAGMWTSITKREDMRAFALAHPDKADQLWGKERRREAERMRIAKSNYLDLWSRLTLPLASLVLILSAVPLALTPPRAGNNRGFLYAVVVLFGSYMLYSVSTGWGKQDPLHLETLLNLETSTYLAMVAWLHIVLMTVFGIILVQRKSKVL